MPWSRGLEDDRRFRRTLLAVLSVCLLLGWLLPQIDIPLPERWEILEEQERLTQLVKEDLPAPVAVVEPKPVDPVDQEESAPEADDEAAPELADKAQPESNPAPAAQANTGTESGPGRGAGSRGLLAFREQFAGVAATNDAVDRLGSNARIHDPSAVTDGRPERSLVTSQAPGSSGGINVAALSRGTGGGTGTQLSGVAVTRATSTLGTGNGNGNGSGTGRGGKGGKGTGSGAMAGRTDEEIQIVFDRHKAALYRLYNRELRQNPTLRGQIVLRLTIQPDGSVSSCEVKSTDMKAPQLAEQVVERVKTFDFGAKSGIPAITIVYPIDFLPAT
jgi:TonB family protein